MDVQAERYLLNAALSCLETLQRRVESGMSPDEASRVLLVGIRELAPDQRWNAQRTEQFLRARVELLHELRSQLLVNQTLAGLHERLSQRLARTPSVPGPEN